MVKNSNQGSEVQEKLDSEDLELLNQAKYQDEEPLNPIKIGKEKDSKKARPIKKKINFWREKLAKEDRSIEIDDYDDSDNQVERQKEEAAKRVAVDIDRSSRGKSPPAMLPKDQVSSELMQAPKPKKKKSFRKRIRRGLSKFSRRK